MAFGIKTISALEKGLLIINRIKLLSALVLSHLHSSATLLSGISKNLIISSEKRLSWAAKTLCDRPKYDTSADLKPKREILPVSFFLKSKIIVHLYKINQNKIAPYRNLDFPNSDYKKAYRFVVPPCVVNCQIFQKSIFRNICDLWNNVILKLDLNCNNTSLKAFKKRLKAHFLAEFRKDLKQIAYGGLPWKEFRFER